MPIDFSEDAVSLTGDSSQAVTLGQELVELYSDLRKRYEDIDKLFKRVYDLEQREIPEAMKTGGVASLTLTSGHVIRVKATAEGQLPNRDKEAERMELFFKWLRDHQHGGMIKREVSLTGCFAKGEEEDADALKADFEKIFGPDILDGRLALKDAPSVNYQTYNAWLRETLTQHTEQGHSVENVDQNCPHCDQAAKETILKFFAGERAEVLVSGKKFYVKRKKD
jgi:hypothetical protein